MEPTRPDARLRFTDHCSRIELKDAVVTLVLYLASWLFAALPFLFLFWLMQPTVRANPGISAYNAPPATRLEPLARKMESPEPSESGEPPSQSSLAINFAQDYSQQLEERREVRAVDRKRPRRVHRRKYEEPAHAYARDWNVQRQRGGR
jgi:hypothetical protein